MGDKIRNKDTGENIKVVEMRDGGSLKNGDNSGDCKND